MPRDVFSLPGKVAGDHDDGNGIAGPFDVLWKNEVRRRGEFRTLRLCLAVYDRFAGIAMVAGS